MSSPFPPQPGSDEAPSAERYDGAAELQELYRFGEAALQQAPADMPWVEVVGGEPIKGNHFDYWYRISRDHDSDGAPTEGICVARRSLEEERYKTRKGENLVVMPDGTATVSWWEARGSSIVVPHSSEAGAPVVGNIYMSELTSGRILTPDKYTVVDRPGKEMGSGKELLPIKRIYRNGTPRAIGRGVLDKVANAFGLDERY